MFSVVTGVVRVPQWYRSGSTPGTRRRGSQGRPSMEVGLLGSGPRNRDGVILRALTAGKVNVRTLSGR